MFRHMIILLTLMLTVTLGWTAQPYTPVHPDPVLEPWRWTTFPELKGLGITSLVEDRDGTMWFGARHGVMRYDGVNWTFFSSKDGLYIEAVVGALLATRDGSLYAGTDMGISKFSNGTWERIFPPEGDLPWKIFDLMEGADGTLWAGTRYGALHLGTGEPELYTSTLSGTDWQAIAPYMKVSFWPEDLSPTARPRHTFSDPAGIKLPAYGVRPNPDIPGFIWRLRPDGPGERAGLKVGDRITAVDGKPGATWAMLEGPENTQVRLTVQRAGKAFDVTLVRGQSKAEVYSVVPRIYEDRAGVLWFGLAEGQILRFDQTIGSWECFSDPDGPSGRPASFLQTQDGVLWAISRKKSGVKRFDGKTWSPIDLSALGGASSNGDIQETRDGTLWINSWHYLRAYRNGAWQVYKSEDMPTRSWEQLLETSDGALWLAGNLGVQRLDLGTSQWTSYEKLRYQCETPGGDQWFLAPDSSAVRYDGRIWMRYGVDDGLMDQPTRLITSSDGVLWAAGGHDGVAATARFDGQRWSRQVHPELSWLIYRVYASSNGDLWFSAAWPRAKGDDRNGVLRFNGKTWTHYTALDGAQRVSYGMGETADGVLWFGGTRGLRRFDGQNWTVVDEPEELISTIVSVYSSREGDLWVGTRGFGVLQFNGQVWTQYDTQDGLAGNGGVSIFQTADGSIWVRSVGGISRFDGKTWTPMPYWGTTLKAQSRDGALWMNKVLWSRPGEVPYHTIRYQPDTVAPETDITLFADEVSQPGNTTLAWSGADPWRSTPETELQFAYRLDDGEWSAFSGKKNRVFQALDSGRHTFEVKTRDQDFNEDPTPASVTFTVVSPVWQQPWFISLMVILLGGIGFQTGRVVRRDRRLREANTALSSANRELFDVNRELQDANELLSTANQQIQEQTERKSAFLASMSHELRTPMNAIKGFTNLVIRRIGDSIPDRQRENLVRVTQASDHLLAMINDLLDLSKIEAGHMDVNPESFSVQTLVASCCATVSPLVDEKPNVTLGYEVADGIEHVHTDQGRVRQMLINLLSNAIKFTDSGRVTVNATQADGQLVISVVDTGKGIPADEIDTIFDEYRQVKGSDSAIQKGTGLGLSITKKFAELLGGSIGVESELGRGTTFAVQIPILYKEV